MLKGGISDNQTSLTVGSTYYVQPNGTFATSAGTPSVLAGKAVSATSLLLNGLAPAPPVIPEEIPSQTGNTGKFLTTDGSAASWGAVSSSLQVHLATLTTSNAVQDVIIDHAVFGSTTYDYLILQIANLKPVSQGGYMRFRHRDSSGNDRTSSNYGTNIYANRNGSFGNITNYTQNSAIFLGYPSNSLHNNQDLNIEVKIYQQTTYKVVASIGDHGQSANYPATTRSISTNNSSFTWGGIKFYMSGNTSGFKSGATFKLYGIKGQ